MNYLKNFTMKKNSLITHSDSFHADDIFAAATLAILLEKRGEDFEIIRTRDREVIDEGDYVFDVGGIYDADKNRFDHHQVGGAGKRTFGNTEVEYAAFGLVWKKFGEEVCGSKDVADHLESKFVASIDANDNGVNLYELKGELVPYSVQDIFFAFRPSWREREDYDKPFFELVDFAKKILIREIKKMQDAVLAESLILKAYEESSDKRIIVLEDHYPWGEVIQNYPEPIFVISPKADTWRVECVRTGKISFENKKNLPDAWGGLRDEDLQKITGVEDAVFCHRALFLAVAKSKEGAMKLAQIAVES